MEDIKMADQKAQYAWLKSELDAAFLSAMGSMGTAEGEAAQVRRFAGRLKADLQVSRVVACAGAAGALQLALLALYLPAGAEVILPAFADAPATDLVNRLGLKPVFADVLPGTFTLDPAATEKAITTATAAVMPVHLFGQCANMEALLQLARKYKLWVLEDNTQAFGADYIQADGHSQKAGTIGDIGITSFYPAKPLYDQGEGAAVLVNDPALALSLEKTMAAQVQGIKEIDVLQAAMLEVKVKHIAEFVVARQRIAAFYDSAFADTPQVQTPERAPYSSHTYQQYAITVAPEIRDGLKEYLRDNHIPSMVYYPQPLHLLEAFLYRGYAPGAFPVAESLSKSILSLPMHSELKEDQLTYICGHVLDYVRKYS
ncbi:DegT/DnrJ/EryC1/StrS family aminotransferase [Pontibacter sp. 172403-2]|uniref:DegT/DnrJ/EryC1/StrS family aminotransferase n=1 Tax=Pontibacter rufus TaxID=2791028 RepID=UPI0018AF5720|nr:DegT/DnrJ/EryC1/StrS family aminotransferase [Pontibacter sp. 172403-2]MBF9253784.1 DegT/DnrJ/EryC1/StrS family aminotransferase [Pontibacter sp. 172403-2]